MKFIPQFKNWRVILVITVAMASFVIPSKFWSGGALEANAATSTVCASGCDFITIAAALADASTSVALVSSTYSSSTEISMATDTTALEIVANKTVDCQNSGAIIGATGTTPGNIALGDNAILRNCILSHVNLESLDSVGGNTGYQITGNTFATNTTSTVSIQHVDSFLIDGNINIPDVELTGPSTGGIVSNNSIYFINGGKINSSNVPGQISNYSIVNNTITNYQAGYLSISLAGNNITFATNTVTFPTNPSGSNAIISTGASGTYYVNGNFITAPEFAGGGPQIIFAVANNPGVSNITLDHNTFFFPSVCANCIGVRVDDSTLGGYAANVTSTYNIFYSAANPSQAAFEFNQNFSTSTFNLYDNYSGYFGFTNNISSVGIAPIFTIGANSKTTDPYLKLLDADATNNLQLAPASAYLDANGSIDIGAYSAVRSSTMFIDQNGTIDYTTVDATSSPYVNDNIRSGDTTNFAAGTYNPITVSSTVATSSIIISGAGAATIFNATSTDAIKFSGVDNSSVNNLTVQNATGSIYTITDAIYDYNSTTYNDGPLVGQPAGTGLIINDGSCGLSLYHADGFDVTSIIGAATDNWNLALADVGGAKLTMFVQNNFASSPAALESQCSGNGILVDHWVTSTFSVSGGNFTYNSSAVAAASTTMTPGFTDPPRIDRIHNTGIKLVNSNGNTFTNVTSTGNDFGVWFKGTSANNNINDSVIQNSLVDDINSDSSGNNNLRNTSFTTASTSITGAGLVNVYNKFRVLVQDQSLTPINGASIDVTDGQANILEIVSTGGDGYTEFSPNFVSYFMSSSSLSVTNGGYNPFTIHVSATSTFDSTSTNQNLISANQTFTLTLASAGAGTTTPSAPTNFVTTTVSTSSVAFTWTDTSSSTAQEDNFIIDYVTSTNSFPGVTSSIAQDATSTTVTGLLPNTLYTFRIAAQNVSGTSAYATTTAFYTPADVPGTPVVSSVSTSTLTVTWASNSNSTSTIYYLLNSDVTFSTTTALTTNLTGLTPSTTYQFQVRAENLGSSGTYSAYSVSSTVTTTTALPTPPTAPSGIATSTVTASSITVSWTDNSSDETGFVLDQSTDGITYSNVSTTAAGVTSTAVSSLSPNTQYWFRVAAFNGTGTSTYSTTTVGTYTLAAVPGTPVVSNVSTSTLTVTWADSSNPAPTVYYLLNSDATFTTTTAVTANLTGLTPDTQYQFQVRAENLGALGTYSSYSASSTATTTLAVSSPTTTPTAPSSFATTTVATSSAGFSWADNSSGSGQENNFILDYTSTTFPGVTSSIAQDATTASVSSLTPNTQYTFRLAATNSAGTSSYATSSAFYTLANTPTSLLATVNSQTQITFTYAGDATQFYAENVTAGTNSGWTASTTFTSGSLTCGQSYLFRVRGRNGDNIETASTTTSGTTSACNSATPSPSVGPSYSSPPVITTTPTTTLPVTTSTIPETTTTPYVQPVSTGSTVVPSIIYLSPDHPNSPITFNLSKTKASYEAGQTLLFSYQYKNYSKLNQRINVIRQLFNTKTKQKILWSTGYATLAPGASFTRQISQKLSTTLIPGDYTIRISVFDANFKLIAENSFNIQVTAKVQATVQNVIFTSYLYLGSQGAEVRALQQKLTDLGFYHYGVITGFFGSATKAAVIEFQKAYNLAPYPGWVGPGTRAALNSL